MDGAVLPDGDPVRDQLEKTVETLNAAGNQRIRLSRSDFSVDVLWDGSALWFGPKAVLGGTAVGLPWRPGEGDLAALLTRIARAELMARMLGAVLGRPSPLSPNPVEVTAQHTAVNVRDLAGLDQDISIRRECAGAHANLDGDAARPLAASTDLKQCDLLAFSVQGRGAGGVDVNRVNIDSQFCVHAAYRRVQDASTPGHLGNDMYLCSDCPSGYSAGEERLFVITTKSIDNAEALNLEGLAENCGPAGGTRGTGASEKAMDFLSGLAARPDTRGVIGGFGLSDIWVERYNWRILPRREAFRRAGRALSE